MLKAVQAVEAVTRKPPEYEDLTFFSPRDIWQMHMVFDNVTCDRCSAHEDSYRGNMLRFVFQYLEIQDYDTIKVNVHPHCRCYLIRYGRE